MAYVQTSDQLRSAGIQELTIDEADAVSGGGVIAIAIGIGLLATAGLAIYSGWQAEHNNDINKS